MSAFFLFHNFHIALELLGALVFAIAAWLAFDAFLIRKDFLTASRGIGFGILSIAQIVHGFGGTYLFSDDLLYIIGASFLFINMLMERPVDRPKLHAIGATMGPSTIVSMYGEHLVAILYFCVALLSYLQYRKETKHSLAPFWNAFLFLFLGTLISAVYPADTFSAAWALAHLIRAVGFISLATWVWQYLSARLSEEIVVIFTSLALCISVVVSLAFSTILMSQIEMATKTNLATNVRMLDFAVETLRGESLAKARTLAADPALAEAFAEEDFETLGQLGTAALGREGVGFLTFVDPNGNVILRAHALTRRDDSAAREQAVAGALTGAPSAHIEISSFEGLSVRAAAPVYHKQKLVGVVLLGYPLDVAFADRLKRVTGLDVSIAKGDEIVASTIAGPDGRTPISQIKITDEKVIARVLSAKDIYTSDTQIAGRAYLASYLPIVDAHKQAIGMLFAAKSQSEIADIAQQTNILTLVTVIVIVLVLIIPLYFVTRRLSQ